MLNIGSIVWGVTDLPRAVAFWCAALDYQPRDDPDDDWATLVPISGPGVQLSLKLVKSPAARRHHLDLFTADQDGEVERLLALGATRPEWRYEPEADYVVLADPDGNPFCVVKKEDATTGSGGR